ncbi:MAG: SEC-C metal-binding domain-containing protein [Bdellovibrionia bacterium]
MIPTQSDKSSPSPGRNEPCPCGSQKKFKRCCGVDAAPKLSVSHANKPPLDPSALEGFNPEMLTQFTQAFQRLPKSQIQRFQAIMQKAMSGKDISREAAEFEKTLPQEFQQMMQSMAAMGLANLGEGTQAGDISPASMPLTGDLSSTVGIPLGDSETAALEKPLTEEEARALVAKAALEGTISKKQADALLRAESELQTELEQGKETEKKSNRSPFQKLWKNLSGSKE